MTTEFERQMSDPFYGWAIGANRLSDPIRLHSNPDLAACLSEGCVPRIADEKTCSRCRCYHPDYLLELAPRPERSEP